MNCGSKQLRLPGFVRAWFARASVARTSKVATFAALLFSVFVFSAATARAQQPAAAAAPAAPTGNAEKGKAAFHDHGCFACHGFSGDGGISPYPTQAGFRMPRPVVTGARLAGMPLTFQAFMNYVRKPGGRMPAFGNTIAESDLADIYAFLKSQPPPPDPKSTPVLNGK